VTTRQRACFVAEICQQGDGVAERGRAIIGE
jgi:hypothetical protein